MKPLTKREGQIRRNLLAPHIISAGQFKKALRLARKRWKRKASKERRQFGKDAIKQYD